MHSNKNPLVLGSIYCVVCSKQETRWILGLRQWLYQDWSFQEFGRKTPGFCRVSISEVLQERDALQIKLANWMQKKECIFDTPFPHELSKPCGWESNKPAVYRFGKTHILSPELKLMQTKIGSWKHSKRCHLNPGKKPDPDHLMHLLLYISCLTKVVRLVLLWEVIHWDGTWGQGNRCKT